METKSNGLNLTCQHVFAPQDQQGHDLVVAHTEGLLSKFIPIGAFGIESGIRAQKGQCFLNAGRTELVHHMPCPAVHRSAIGAYVMIYAPGRGAEVR